MRVGEAFVHMSIDEANEMMSTMKTKLEAEVAVLKAEQDGMDDTLKKLKGELYAKFGDAINLDNAEAGSA